MDPKTGELVPVVTTNGVTTNGVITNGVTTNGVITNGVTTNGVTTSAATTNGATTNGATTNGATTNGAKPAGISLSVTATKPVRSWKRGDRTAGTYDAKFEYEGATIFLQSLSDEDWDELETQEEELQDESEAIQEEQRELNHLQSLSLEDLLAKGLTSRHLRERRRAFNRRQTAVADRLFSFQEQVVQKCVSYWDEKAPLPYSPENVAALPKEMIAEWAQVILEKSRLGKSSANFLANK